MDGLIEPMCERIENGQIFGRESSILWLPIEKKVDKADPVMLDKMFIRC
jgi:hypothetical protein